MPRSRARLASSWVSGVAASTVEPTIGANWMRDGVETAATGPPSPCGITPAGAAAVSAGEIAVVEAVATGAVAGSVLVVAWGSPTPISIGGPELVHDAVAMIATMHAAIDAERFIARSTPGRCGLSRPRIDSLHDQVEIMAGGVASPRLWGGGGGGA